jgi:hypothetical protein
LPFPTALLTDADDRIYVSVHGAFCSSMSGVVVRFDHLAERAPGQPPLRI